MEFFDSLRAMEEAAQDPLLIDGGPQEHGRNSKARILRNGLSVCVFSNLELFLEEEFKTLAKALSDSRVTYNALPDSLRRFLTLDAVTGIANRASFMDHSNRIVFSESSLVEVARFAEINPTYTALGFSPRGSNVSEEDVKKAFACFGQRDAWGAMKKVALAIGSNPVSIQDDFRSLVRARHSSAHNAVANVPSGDLVSNI